MLYQWVWVHAPRHFPSLIWSRGGHLLFSGAFYVEMWLWWLAFLSVAALLDWFLHRDDPAWKGFGRNAALSPGLRGAFALLVFLCLALTALAVTSSHSLHGLLSLSLALLTAGIFPALLPANRVSRAPAPLPGSATAPGTPPDTLAAEARSLAAEARPLTAADFPAFVPDLIAQHVSQALAPKAGSEE